MAPISVYPILEILEGKEAEAIELAKEFTRVTSEDEKDSTIYYAWSRFGNQMHVQELYVNVAAFEKHMIKTFLPRVDRITAIGKVTEVKVHCTAEDKPALHALNLLPPFAQFCIIECGHGLEQ